MKTKEEKPIMRYCEYECSKYCEIADLDMGKKYGKYCCKACYNCATKKYEFVYKGDST